MRVIDGRRHVFEQPLPADVALIKACRADRWGNLVYRSAARNFGPTMATAAALTVVQVREIVELGELDPEAVVTPGHLRRPRRPGGAHDHRGRCKAPDANRRCARADRRATSPTAPTSTWASACRRWSPTPCRAGKEIVYHSENGILGMGPAPAPGEEDPELINAGKQPVTLLPGGVYFHHTDAS